MPYTLLKFLLWFGLAALIGFVIGWLLRSLKCRAEVANARSVTVDGDDVERMRHRLANLEQVVAERDRLRMQVADLRAADSPGVVGAAMSPVDAGVAVDAEPPAVDEVADDANQLDDAEPADGGEAVDESSIIPDRGDAAARSGEPDGSTRITGLVAVPDLVENNADENNADENVDVAETSIAENGADEDESGENVDVAGDGDREATGVSDQTVDAPADLDLGAAATVLGKKIKLDDLTVVEGIGPKISELCRGIGVETWRGLADTEIADLRSMLDAAGSRYQIHKPASWPQQAELLATGQWDDFVALTDSLDGGR